MRARRREAETFSLSFLDIIACGFGAVILLLVITLAFQPRIAQEDARTVGAEINAGREAREDLVTERRSLLNEIEQKRQALGEIRRRAAALAAEVERTERQLGTTRAQSETTIREEERLRAVQQALSEEMRRLLAQREEPRRTIDSPIGGIPVDSEYILFVVDTSGSMKLGAWPLVVRKVQEVLETYPKTKGFQIMSDVGTYMFPTYAAQWIPDTPARRALVLNQMQNWNAFSRSDPAPGVISAIRTFANTGRPMSIFIFGDDFNGTSIDSVVQTVSQFNRQDANGNWQIRIHAVGFPTLPVYTKLIDNFMRFAHLMRTLAERNGGAFVGLNSVR